MNFAKSSTTANCWETDNGRPTIFLMGCCIGSNLLFTVPP